MKSLLVAEQHSRANSNIRQMHKYSTERCFDLSVMVLLYDSIMKWKESGTRMRQNDIRFSKCLSLFSSCKVKGLIFPSPCYSFSSITMLDKGALVRQSVRLLCFVPSAECFVSHYKLFLRVYLLIVYETTLIFIKKSLSSPFGLECRYAAVVWRPCEWTIRSHHHCCICRPGKPQSIVGSTRTVGID